MPLRTRCVSCCLSKATAAARLKILAQCTRRDLSRERMKFLAQGLRLYFNPLKPQGAGYK
jgi:hypothetical protein